MSVTVSQCTRSEISLSYLTFVPGSDGKCIVFPLEVSSPPELQDPVSLQKINEIKQTINRLGLSFGTPTLTRTTVIIIIIILFSVTKTFSKPLSITEQKQLTHTHTRKQKPSGHFSSSSPRNVPHLGSMERLGYLYKGQNTPLLSFVGSTANSRRIVLVP